MRRGGRPPGVATDGGALLERLERDQDAVEVVEGIVGNLQSLGPAGARGPSAHSFAKPAPVPNFSARF